MIGSNQVAASGTTNIVVIVVVVIVVFLIVVGGIVGLFIFIKQRKPEAWKRIRLSALFVNIPSRSSAIKDDRSDTTQQSLQTVQPQHDMSTVSSPNQVENAPIESNNVTIIPTQTPLVIHADTIQMDTLALLNTPKYRPPPKSNTNNNSSTSAHVKGVTRISYDYYLIQI